MKHVIEKHGEKTKIKKKLKTRITQTRDLVSLTSRTC
jgi:hypothetical protein